MDADKLESEIRSISKSMQTMATNIALIQQQRAQKKLEALRKLTSPTARVIRDGIPSEIHAELLVPGDIIELDSGDRIPADARILACSSCQVNEASLTGESVPVIKNNAPRLESNIPISERSNMVYRGTFIQLGIANQIFFIFSRILHFLSKLYYMFFYLDKYQS